MILPIDAFEAFIIRSYRNEMYHRSAAIGTIIALKSVPSSHTRFQSPQIRLMQMIIPLHKEDISHDAQHADAHKVYPMRLLQILMKHNAMAERKSVRIGINVPPVSETNVPVLF